MDGATATAGHLQHLIEMGYLPPPGVAVYRSPVMENMEGEQIAEVIPNPYEDEWVCFIPFLLRGLGFPISSFLCGLLHFYGLQLHHLTPNVIPHIACFMDLYELFLGIESHFDL